MISDSIPHVIVGLASPVPLLGTCIGQSNDIDENRSIYFIGNLYPMVRLGSLGIYHSRAPSYLVAYPTNQWNTVECREAGRRKSGIKY